MPSVSCYVSLVISWPLLFVARRSRQRTDYGVRSANYYGILDDEIPTMSERYTWLGHVPHPSFRLFEGSGSLLARSVPISYLTDRLKATHRETDDITNTREQRR